MNLEPERVAATGRFLEAYARTALSEIEAVTDRQPHTDAPVEPPSDLSSAFVAMADAASALREAAQWALYLDADRTRRLLAESGRLFQRMGYPFGAYLLVVAGDWAEDPPYGVFSQSIDSLGVDTQEEPSPELLHPQQQVYLLLASGGSAPISREFSRPLARILDTSLHQDGVIPVGALGTPIRQLWDIARHLVNGEADAPARIAEHLAAMCARYDETMRLAQANSYLWENAAAPVDVGDIDIAGIAALAARRFSGDAVLQALERQRSSTALTPIALAPVEAGIALVEPPRTEFER